MSLSRNRDINALRIAIFGLGLDEMATASSVLQLKRRALRPVYRL